MSCLAAVSTKSTASSVQKAAERQPSEELALLRDQMLSEIPALDSLLRRSVRIANLQTFLSQADLKTRAGNILMLCVLSGVGLALLVLMLSPFPQFAWLGTAKTRDLGTFQNI